MPKFNGDDEDWLDDETSLKSTRRGRHVKKISKDNSKRLVANQINARVVEVFPHQCRVRLIPEGQEVLCSYRRVLLLKNKDSQRERSPVAVGDEVHAKLIEGGLGVVEAVGPRRNSLQRPAPELETLHTLVANADVLIIVAAAQNPAFSSGLVDRFMVAAAIENIEVILVVNKIDLFESGRPWLVYERLGVPVIEVSVKQKLGLVELKAAIQNRTAVFCGHSGVGKTSLLNCLLDSEHERRVGAVSQVTGKGQHTTTGAVMLPGTLWVDTPGVRAFGLNKIKPNELKKYFPEFSELHCESPNCLHIKENGCEAEQLERYLSYSRIYFSLLDGEG